MNVPLSEIQDHYLMIWERPHLFNPWSSGMPDKVQENNSFLSSIILRFHRYAYARPIILSWLAMWRSGVTSLFLCTALASPGH